MNKKLKFSVAISISLIMLIQSAILYTNALVTGSNWMSQLDSKHLDKKLSYFSIPGSHDTMAYHSPEKKHYAFSTEDSWQTQNKSLWDQLKMGVRFLDIRLTHNGNLEDDLEVRHGRVYLNKFTNVLNSCKGFFECKSKRDYYYAFKK